MLSTMRFIRRLVVTVVLVGAVVWLVYTFIASIFWMVLIAGIGLTVGYVLFGRR